MTKSGRDVRRTQESRSAETRGKLLRAAIQSLYTRGYAATTTLVLAEDAKLSRGAMLHQFPTRVDLMLYVVETVYRDELALYGEKFAAIADPRARLLALPEIVWDVLSRPAGVAVLEIMQGARSDPDLAARLRPLQIAIEKDSFRVVDKMANAADVVMSPALKRLIHWAVRGLSIARLLTDEPDEIGKSVRLLKQMLADLIEQAGDGAAPSRPALRVIGSGGRRGK